MRIAIHNPTLSDSGWMVGSFRAEETCMALSDLGVEGVVASPFVKNTYSISSTFDAVSLPKHPIHRLTAFLKIVRAGDFDIVQERLYSGGVLWNGCGLMASACEGLPFVVEAHNLGSPNSLVKRLPANYLSMWHGDLVLAYAELSRYMTIGVDMTKIVHVQNGFSYRLFRKYMKEQTDNLDLNRTGRGQKTFGFFGELSKEKGVDVILQTAEILSKRSDIHFVFAGKGALEVEVSRLSRRKGSNVSYLGLLGRAETIDQMRRCRATIALSNAWAARIGNPVKVIESLALGVIPIITVDSAVNSSLKAYCAQIQNLDPLELARVIERLAAASTEKCVPQDIEDFSIEQIAKNTILPAYRSLMR